MSSVVNIGKKLIKGSLSTIFPGFSPGMANKLVAAPPAGDPGTPPPPAMAPKQAPGLDAVNRKPKAPNASSLANATSVARAALGGTLLTGPQGLTSPALIGHKELLGQ